jgi:ABC-type Zn uptake system ZnuABC Zn-binding protein ZnuA
MMEIIIDAPTPELKEAMEKKIANHLKGLRKIEREYNDRLADKKDKETS